MRLADAPEQDTKDGASITISPALFHGDAGLEALFAPFHECVVLHEALIRDRGTLGPARLLMAEIRGDHYDAASNVVRRVCTMSTYTEKPSENDDVAAGTEWRERVGTSTVFVHRLFGGSTAIHVASAKGNAVDASVRALAPSPLAILSEVVGTTSDVEHVSCSRGALTVPQWHLQASLRDARRFEEIGARVRALGFAERRGKYWSGQIIVQPVGKDRWMAAVPGIDFN